MQMNHVTRFSSGLFLIPAVKNIIPAVASTNAVIAAACVHEAYKCLTFSGQLCNTYMLYNGQSMAG
jgi:hypothetical protein